MADTGIPGKMFQLSLRTWLWLNQGHGGATPKQKIPPPKERFCGHGESSLGRITAERFLLVFLHLQEAFLLHTVDMFHVVLTGPEWQECPSLLNSKGVGNCPRLHRTKRFELSSAFPCLVLHTTTMRD